MKLFLKIGAGFFLAIIIITALFMSIPMLPIAGNYRVLTVLSGSMEPAIRTGSAVVVVPADNYKIGEVITFGEIGKIKRPTTHRITDIKIAGGKPVYMTKGDANDIGDSQEIAQSKVMGKVLFSIPYLGYALNFAKRPIGFALTIILPAALIIREEVKKIYRELSANRKGVETRPN
jgi:signal peptidase